MIHFIVAILIVALFIGGAYLLSKWIDYKQLNPLQKAFFWYRKAKPGSIKRKALAEILDRLLVAELDKCAESRELKEKYAGMMYWTPESIDDEGLPVIDFFNTRLSELIEKEDAEKERLLLMDAEREAESLKRIQNATNVGEALDAYKMSSSLPSNSLARKKLEWFSLIAVLNAKTIRELYEAERWAPDNSLAKKFVPYMHELISQIAVHTANTVDELISAGDSAPNGSLPDTALYVCFRKLHQRLKIPPFTARKVA